MAFLEGRSLSIFVVPLVFLVISLVAVSLRCFVRLKVVRSFGWDDVCMVLAMLIDTMFAICGMLGAVYGMGREFEDIKSLHDIEKALFYWWLGQCSYVLTCCVTKISITLGILRLTVRGLYSTILYIVIAVSVVVCLVFWFMLTLECQPVSYFWKRLYPDANGHCLGYQPIITMAWIYSITAMLGDLTLTILPAFLIWNLQMNRRTKAALIAIIGLGGIASAAVIVRLPFLHTYKNKEFLYATCQISVWSNVEGSLGIIAGSLTTLRPLFRFFRDRSYAYRTESAGASRLRSYPLSNRYATNRSNDLSYRRMGSDSEPEDPQYQTVFSTVQADPGSDGNSQEHLAPKENQFYRGVNVHKTFTVTTDKLDV